MPSNTPNLTLYKKNPATDGADTFNIATMLNENWDKLDTAVAGKAPVNNPTFTGTATLPATTSIGPVSATEISYVDGVTSPIQTQIGDRTTLQTTEKNSLVAAVNELFTSASNGKTAVASAITGKGVAASGSDTYTQLSTKIGQISTGTGNAVAADVLVGKTFTNGSSAGITGTMPNNGAVNRTPSNVSQSIPAGYTSGGTVSAVVVPAANVLTGTTIAGTAGSMPNRGAPTITPSTVDQSLSAGYYSGGTVLGDPDLIAANIRQGVDIFGISGTLVDGKRWASGATVTDAAGLLTVNGLAFRPSYFMAASSVNAGLNQRKVAYGLGFETPMAKYDNGVVTAVMVAATVNASGFTASGFFNAATSTAWVAFE